MFVAEDTEEGIVGGSPNLVWEYKASPYRLVVAEIREDLYHPYVVREGDGSLAVSFGAMGDVADARRCLKVWYHDQQQDLVSGQIVWVDRELLEPHPVNSRIYYEGEGGESKRVRDVDKRRTELQEQAYDRTITITTTGLVVSGNIHWYATQGMESFKKLKCEVRQYTQAEEVQAIVLENASKERSALQKQAEALAVLHAQRMLARQRQIASRHGTTQEKEAAKRDAGNAAQKAAEILKENNVVEMGEASLNKLDFITQRIKAYKKTHPRLARLLEQVKEKSLESANSLLKDVPESHRERVASVAIADDLLGAGRGKKSIKKIYQELKAEEIAKAGAPEGLEELFDFAKTKGDEPENNRLTPPEIIELLKEFYPDGKFIDVFAELEKSNIPAQKHISILEDAYSVDWCWDDGTPAAIYSNIPWNQPGQVFARLDDQVRQGKVVEAVLIASNTILHNATCQSFISEYAPVIIPWKRGNGVKRLEFAPGTYLLHHKPDAGTNNSNKDVIFLYYGQRQDAFKQIFGNIGTPLVTLSAAAKRVYKFWEEKIASWGETESFEFTGGFLSYKEDDEGLFRVFINGELVSGLCAEEEDVIKAMALGYAMVRSHEFSPFDF